MADEAVMKDRLEEPINFTVNQANSLEKGAVLKMTDNRVAIINSGMNDIIAGINGREKLAGDTRTSTPVFRRGVFAMVCSGSVTTGDAVAVAAQVNQIHTAQATVKSGSIIGIALMDGADDEVIHIDVHVGSGGNQVS
ncbi:hypothetical protein LCGC14_2958470 [marine sediment metagenome]|uniref:Uncharacterized protein n=1 Tax=marine sediment metagenome TaxID=412755 RepID=A0A0F8Y0D6_9ZZZZ